MDKFIISHKTDFLLTNLCGRERVELPIKFDKLFGLEVCPSNVCPLFGYK